jgi:hypothetical protein
MEVCGDQAVWFMDRVPDNIPEYYTIIKKPMWLNKIDDRLNEGFYSSPCEFYEDLRQIWINAKKYNPKGAPLHTAADRAERRLDDAWHQMGLISERTKRQNAGQVCV